MKRSILLLTTIVCFASLVCSCGHEEVHADPMPIERLDLVIADDATLPTAVDGLGESAIRHLKMYSAIIGADTLDFGLFVDNYRRSRAVEVFTPDVVKLLPDMSDVELELGEVRQRWQKLFPSIAFPGEAVAMVSPFRQSVFFVDSTLFIASNHFLGPDYEGYEGFPASERKLKSSEYIAPTVAEALLRTHFPYNDIDKTLLKKMIYEGAIAHAKQAIVNGDSPAEALGLSQEEFKFFVDNEPQIWRELVGANLLFTADAAVARRYVDSPLPTQIGAINVPAGVGRFLGFRIVGSLLDKMGDQPNSVPTILQQEIWNDTEVLKKAAYSPRG